MRCDVPELQEQIVTNFPASLNREIADVVVIQPYWSFDDVCKLAIKLKKILKCCKGFLAEPQIEGTYFLEDTYSNQADVDVLKKEQENEKLTASVKQLQIKSDKRGGKCFKCHSYGNLLAY